VGHAVSKDLETWIPQPTALPTGPPGSWDDMAIWTGSVHRYDRNRWLMAYTGITREAGHIVERIGLAWSTDLSRWVKDARNPVVTSDRRWYEQPGGSGWQHGWRDPYLVRTEDGWAMLISARFLGLEADRAGAVALATSPDCHEWTVKPPIAGTSGYFAEVEVPQLLTLAGRHHLIFSARTNGPWPTTSGGAPTPKIGSFALSGERPFGPYSEPPSLVDGDEKGTRYGGRIITDVDGGLAYMAFLDGGSDSFVGAISDPTPVEVHAATGQLRVRFG